MRRFVGTWSALAALLLVNPLACGRPNAAAGQVDPAAIYTAFYPVAVDERLSPEGDATTTVGGQTFDINTFLGADRYYDHTTPITGQSTISSNLEAGFFWNGH